MRTSGFLLTLLALATLVGAPNPRVWAEKSAPPAIVWQGSWPQTQALARKTHKPILLYFAASWCDPCRRLEDKTLGQKSVVRVSRRWVAFKADLDQEGDLAARFGVETPPTLLFLSADGRVVEKIVGFTDAATLTETLTRASKRGKATS